MDVKNVAKELYVKELTQIDNALIVQNKSNNTLEMSPDGENWMLLNYGDVIRLSEPKTVYLRAQLPATVFVAGEGVL